MHSRFIWWAIICYNTLIILLFILMLSLSQIWQWNLLQAVFCVLLTCFLLLFEHFFTFWLKEIFQTYLNLSCPSPGRSHFSKEPQFLSVEGSVWPFQNDPPLPWPASLWPPTPSTLPNAFLKEAGRELINICFLFLFFLRKGMQRLGRSRERRRSLYIDF